MFVFHRSLAIVMAVLVLLAGASAARAADEDEHPLAPADTSSPRATLQSFTTIVDAQYAERKRGRLSAEMRNRLERRVGLVSSCFDLTDVPSSLVDSMRRQVAVDLKEVLDRIGLPPVDTIPDAETVAAQTLTRWRVPHSEITLVRIPAGPRSGEWVFSADTVARAEEFYSHVAHLPYLPGAGSPGLRDMFVESPGWMVPDVWISGLPGWARLRAGGVTIWQWVAATILLAGGIGLVGAAFRFTGRAVAGPNAASLASSLAPPLVLVGTCLGLDFLITSQVRLTGDVLFAAKTGLRVGLFGGGVLLVQAVLRRLGEAVIQSRRLRPDTIDTQVVRLGFRILTILAMAWMVILGADSMGISVTPLIAGLGVGGLAVALAAQHTVENFIAGLVLFADKPVRIGDTCQCGEHRGTVEQIGLRSTRIRSLDRALVSIPNSEFAKLRLVNYSRRDKTLLKTTLGLRYETTADQLRHVLAGLRQSLAGHPRVDAESVRVRFVGYGAYSLDIEIFALVETSDWATFLMIQEDVLLEMMGVVHASGCGFAFPSQTHYVTADAGVDAAGRQRAEEQVRAVREAGGLAVAGFFTNTDAVTIVAGPPQRIHRPAA